MNNHLAQSQESAIAMTLVATVALGSSTYAWFVSNTKVSATSSSVKATSATPNLLIVAGTESNGAASTTGGKTAEEITATTATALYPTSTKDCSTWWAVQNWESVSGVTKASVYYNPTITDTANGTNVMDGRYTLGSTPLNAYQVSTYSLYTTTTDTVELNLDPVNPISVDITSASATDAGEGFKKALRVGIVVDDTLKLVYAPTAVSGSGNDKVAVTGWAQVKDNDETEAATFNHVETSTFTGWTATDLGGAHIKKQNTA